MKLEKMNRLFVIIITIVGMGYLLSACDSKNDAKTHYNLGLLYGRQGKLEDAIAELQQVIQIDPNYAPAHYNLGLLYGRQG
ncbi:MAG: tetratricopeptide repeat protein, partial [Candidatus Poribacteria bacterium]|nr:tetratricopeptide repeat protein [Candidatus Poribacteria bacterium]